MKKLTTIIILLTVSLFTVQCNEQEMKKVIKRYTGDGKIKDISFRHMLFFSVKGYSIEFKKFDLTQDFEDTYILENLPIFDGLEPRIYLSIADNNNWQDEQIREMTNYLEFSLVDDEGVKVIVIGQKLNRYRWSTGPYLKNYKFGYALYDFDNSAFKPSSNKTYKLQVKYNGNNELKGAIGYFYIRCGGSL